jgi:hypothetical protein
VQLQVKGGVAEFELIAPAEAQDVRLRVSAGDEMAQGRIAFVPDLRPMIAAGLLEGVVSFRHRATLEPLRRGDVFEQEITSWSRDFNQGRHSAAARAAFFLKGTIKGDLLLTAAYDSDKETRARLLRDIQPEQVYPVYGDASLRSFDARSGSRLYLRLDSGKSYLLWGDFVTGDGFSQPLGQGAVASLKQRSLGAYNRTRHRVRLHHETATVAGNVFALRDTLRQVVEEFASQGSGPYGLRNSGVLEGSEKVEVSCATGCSPRASSPSAAAAAGRLRLRALLGPHPADAVPARGRRRPEPGVAARHLRGRPGRPGLLGRWRRRAGAPGASVEVGGAVVEDRNPLAPYRLRSANATWLLGPRSAVVLEVAGSHSEVNRQRVQHPQRHRLQGARPISGQAWRVELAHEGDGHEAACLRRPQRPEPSTTPPHRCNGGRGEAWPRAS